MFWNTNYQRESVFPNTNRMALKNMNFTEIEPLLDASERLVSETELNFRRSLANEIDWNDRLICLKGPKGTGKTTLILQHIKESFGARSEKAVYLALDHLWFSSHDILPVIDWLYANEYTHVFLDEVHHAENWQALVKTICDFYPKLNVVYSGSSILKLTSLKADLSRRQAVYDLKGLSFREFLKLEGVLDFEPATLETVLRSHRSMAGDITDRIKVLPLFRRYLSEGYYPLYRSVSSQFGQRLSEVVSNVLETDVPSVVDITQSTIRKAKKMLMILAGSCPQTPNMTGLYRELETDRNVGIKMFGMLEAAELIQTVRSGTAEPKLKRLGTVEKVFLGDPNLMNALVPDPDVGAVRETFFVNQLKAAGHDVVTPQQGDFVVDGKHLFEIGGKGKGFNQIKDVPDSYVVNDDVEVGRGNKIPLWLFGFLY
mgnify:CR=1 FL=1